MSQRDRSGTPTYEWSEVTNAAFLTAYDAKTAPPGTWYGSSSIVGEQESVRLTSGGALVSHAFHAAPAEAGASQRYRLRVFARTEAVPPYHPTTNNLRLEIKSTTGTFSVYQNIKVLPGEFKPYEVTFTVPASAELVSVVVKNLTWKSLLLDSLVLYAELPNFGYFEQDGQLLPAFPSDIDERASGLGWRYCDDVDFLEGLP